MTAMLGVGGDNWTSKTHKALVNHHQLSVLLNQPIITEITPGYAASHWVPKENIW